MGINPFIEYFTSTINRAQEIAKEEVDFVLSKARFYEVYADKISERQGKVLTRMFAEGRQGFEGGMSTKK